MKKGFKNLVVVGSFLMLASVAGLVLAQEATAPQTNSLVAANCFDYYKFGSVTASITPNSAEIASGGELGLTINLKNENAYPIVNGLIYVKIYQRQTDAKAGVKNGGFLVDEFVVKDKVSIDGGATKTVEYPWRVPAAAPIGNYDIYTYFLSAQKLNILGLPFTEDITGGSNSFKVVGDTSKAVSFNKNKVTLNGKIFQFVGAPVVLSKDEKATFKIPLDNPTSENQTVRLTYELYFWSGIEDAQRLTAKSETVELKAGESKTLTYEVSNANYPVYFLSVKAKWNDFSSILNARFARSGIERARINFVSINKFPLGKGETAPVLACIHNAALGAKTTGKLKVELLDQEYNVLGEYAYSGDITGSMMGLKADFTAPSDIGAALIRATLSDDQGKIVDQVNLNYDCREIDPQKCPAGSTLPPSGGGPKVDMMWIIVGAAIILIVIIIVIVMAKRNKGIPPPSTPISNAPNPIQKGPSAGMMVILVGGVITSLLIPSGLPAEAKSVDYRVTEGEFQNVDITSYPVKFNTLVLDALNINYRVTYKANAVIRETGQIVDDNDGIDSARIGETIRVSYDDNDFTTAGHNIEWLELGNIFGTPYGHWDRDADGQFDYPYVNPLACNPNDATTLKAAHADSPGNFWDVSLFAPFVMIEPTKTVTAQGATCTPGTNPTYFDCIVNGTAGQQGYAEMAFIERDGRHYIDAQNSDVIGAPCGFGLHFNDVKVPGQTIRFPFNITGASAATTTLAAPVLTGPTAGVRWINYTYKARVETNPPASSITYTFQRKFGAAGAWSNFAVNSATYPNYANGVISFGNLGNYQIRVRAQAGGNTSPWSAILTVVIGNNDPGTPECSNTFDDGDVEDSLFDAADPGCHVDNDLNKPYDPNDDTEANPPTGGTCVVGAPKKAIGTCSASCGPGVQVYENYISGPGGICEKQYTTESCNLRACGSRIREGNPGGQ